MFFNKDRIVEEFIKLVKIDSISGKERKVADVLTEELKKMGLEVCEDSAGEKAGTDTGNLIARVPGNNPDAPVIMFCAHMDTVQPGEKIQPVVKNGVIYSSGDTVLGADNKAGIAAILEALRVIKENGISHGDLLIVFTIWEEGGLVGSSNIDYGRVNADMGFVLDSDGDPGNIVVRGPSQDSIIATVKGKAAHAGINPQDGINAIQVASEAIANMKLGRIDDETTANIGTISGGKAVNIVPENVTVHGETRSMNYEKRAAHTEAICFALRKAARDAQAEVDIRTQTIYTDMHLQESEPVVNLAFSAAKSLGLEANLTSTGGGSDANNFNNHGIPTVNLGIGMKQVHTTSEFIAVDNLVLNARYIVEIIKTATENSLKEE